MRCALTILSMMAAATAAAGPPFFTGVGDLPGGDVESFAEGVSNGMVVVGRSANDESFSAAFRWENGVMTELGSLGEPYFSWAHAISADGLVIVGSSTSPNGDGYEQAFAWTAEGGMIGLPSLPYEHPGSVGFGVSADGSVVVGMSSTGLEQAVRWVDGEVQSLGDLPGGYDVDWAFGVSADGLVIVGRSHSGSGNEAFRWENGVMQGLGDFPGGWFESSAYGVSDDGSVVVGVGSTPGGVQAFRWENGVMEGLGDDDFLKTSARAVSADGEVIVGVFFPEEVAFIWTRADGMRVLESVLEDDHGLDLSGWEVGVPTDISPDGRTIVGYGINPQGDPEGWIAHLGSCEADCDGSGDLSLFDFLCFVNLFNNDDPGADCDADGGLDLFDFFCFVNEFNEGC